MPVIGYRKDAAGKVLGIFYNDLYDTSAPRYMAVPGGIKSRAQCKSG